MKALLLFLGTTIILDAILYPILERFKHYQDLIFFEIAATLWMVCRGLNIINLTIVFAFILKDYV